VGGEAGEGGYVKTFVCDGCGCGFRGEETAERKRRTCIRCRGPLPVGTRSGRWTIVGEPIRGRGCVRYPCRCDCGTEAVVEKGGGRVGLLLHSEACKACRTKAVVGLRVGTRTLVDRNGRRGLVWKCDCGAVSRVPLKDARNTGCRKCVAAPKLDGIPVTRAVLNILAREVGSKRDTLRSKIINADALDRIAYLARHGSPRPG
jgi:RNase P subunit RPR2